ncbi:MAG: FGGY-family carbohydrate kinase [Lawsonibacter sp.]|nr:FGGY-family carbohydrate kinase [Lawsonibacter sp.]
MGEQHYLMGIDIGTYESKGTIVDAQGKVLAFSAEPHGMERPKPNYYEHDADQVWWHDLCVLVQRLLEKSGIAKEEIAALGVSTLGTNCLPVDKELKPLRKAILYGIDARSQKEIEFLTEYYGEERTKELFGRPICSGDVCAKILWIRNHEPEVYENTYKFLTGTSYLVAKLTGEFVIDRFLGLASLRPLYHEDGRIRVEMCSLFCRPDQLPEGRVVTDVAGRITAQAAQSVGLVEGTPVIVGSGDSAAEAVSSGVLHPGDVMVQFGSSMFLYCCTDRLITDDRVRGNRFLIPNTYSVAAGTNNCGTVTKWFRDNLYPEAVALEKAGGPNAYETMMRAVEHIPVGSSGLVTLPYFAGERTPINDPNAKGLMLGLSLDHTKHHMYRSALEGIAFSVAQHIDILKENGIGPLRILGVGGGTKNKAWMQMVADAMGESLHIPDVTVGASYGDALMAGIGVGIFQDFADLQRIIKPSVILAPDAGRQAQYRQFRAIYDAAYLANKHLMHQL